MSDRARSASSRRFARSSSAAAATAEATTMAVARSKGYMFRGREVVQTFPRPGFFLHVRNDDPQRGPLVGQAIQESRGILAMGTARAGEELDVYRS